MRLTDEELVEAFDYAHGSLRLTAALSELRERRAADLTADEREVLEWLRLHLAAAVEHPEAQAIDIKLAALATLDRLIAGGGK